MLLYNIHTIKNISPQLILNAMERIALVTGPSSGIGREIAKLLSEKGYTLILASRNIRALEELRKRLGGLAIKTDVSRRQDLEQLVKTAIGKYGKIDVLVNNAGVGLYGPLEELNADDIEYIIKVNFLAPVLLSQMVVGYMIRRGDGCIVNISSLAAYAPLPWFSIYAAAKAALKVFTDGLRIELRPYGIRVIGVYPGYVETMFAKNTITPSEVYREVEILPPMQRTSPKKVAEAVVNAITKGKNGDVYIGLINRLAKEALVHTPRISSLYINRAYKNALKKLRELQKTYNESR